MYYNPIHENEYQNFTWVASQSGRSSTNWNPVILSIAISISWLSIPRIYSHNEFLTVTLSRTHPPATRNVEFSWSSLFALRRIEKRSCSFFVSVMETSFLHTLLISSVSIIDLGIEKKRDWRKTLEAVLNEASNYAWRMQWSQYTPKYATNKKCLRRQLLLTNNDN